MSMDAFIIRFEDSSIGDVAQRTTDVLRRTTNRAIKAVFAQPSDEHIAQQREYERLKKDAWEKIEQATPTHMRSLLLDR